MCFLLYLLIHASFENDAGIQQKNSEIYTSFATGLPNVNRLPSSDASSPQTVLCMMHGA